MTAKEQQIVKRVARLVRNKFKHEVSGHDWYHIERVWKMARRIALEENGADIFVVELAALLHEEGDYKLEKDGKARHAQRATEILKRFSADDRTIGRVAKTVERVSFSSNLGKLSEPPSEAKIVQDADRLEALGAIGIARIFTVGGSRGRPVYDPLIKPVLNASPSQYKKLINTSTSVNHFYEKILLLKDRMHTKTAKALALRRHKFMRSFLREFFKEWRGKA